MQQYQLTHLILNLFLNGQKKVNWLKLDILSINNGEEFDDNGYVEFKAYFLENRKVDFIHGKSRFIKQANHWVYLDEL